MSGARTARQEFALRHPLTNPADPMGAYRLVEARPNGDLLTSILAVDR